MRAIVVSHIRSAKIHFGTATCDQFQLAAVRRIWTGRLGEVTLREFSTAK
jgi:hypothetical protein